MASPFNSQLPSFTTWTRIEPHPRDGSLQRSLQAQIRDPLWMLCRQWQVGEFEGEDAGSPVSAVMGVANRSITTYRPGTDPAGTVALGATLPVEVRVERAPSGLKLRGSVELGLALEESIRAAITATTATSIINALRKSFPISAAEPDPAFAGAEGADLRLVAAGRVLDGEALYQAYSARGVAALPAPARVAAMTPVLTKFVALRSSLFSEPSDPGSWQSTELRYEFTLGSPVGTDRLLLEAAEFRGGHLDWYDFTFSQGTAATPADAANQAAITTTTFNFLPNHVTFKGMPGSRWWDFEPGSIDFGQLAAEQVDLARMLVMEFALVYGNDWFVVSAPTPVGSVSSVTNLVVTDTFGTRTLIRPADTAATATQPAWSMFKLSGAGGARSSFLLLAPTLGVVDDSPVLEEVNILRDDLSALAWAVEHVLSGTNDRPVDAYEAYLGRIATNPPPAPVPLAGDPPIFYTVETTVPDNWIPLVPVRTPAGALYFRRGTVDVPTATGIIKLQARASLLQPGTPFFVTDHIVSRVGTTARINMRRTRAKDGSTSVWRARRSGPGRGPGWSGLRYDFIRQFGVP